MKTIVIAPNTFKDALEARKVTEAIVTGLKKSRLECQLIPFPIGDGGDGTCNLISQFMNGETVEIQAGDPLNRKMKTSYGLIEKEQTAVIEMSNISGIHLLGKGDRNPLLTSSRGVGELIYDAIGRGATRIIVGMGGSATVDGGCGLLHALGGRFYDEKGRVLQPIPKELEKIHTVDIDKIDSRIKNCEFIVLCDVDNPLLGENGAAAVFGPQKGAKPSDVTVLDDFLRQWRNLSLRVTGKDMNKIAGGGTAGGAAAGMYAYLGAELVKGVDYFLSLTDFEKVLKEADVLITGEGNLDEQTLSGKAPVGVAKMARAYDIPVIGLAGKIPLTPSEKMNAYFDALFAINNELQPLPEAIDATEENLIRTAEMIGNILAIK